MKIDSLLRIKKDEIKDVEKFKEMLTLVNPEYKSAKRQGFSTYNIEKYLNVYKDNGDFICAPRYTPCSSHLKDDYNIGYEWVEGNDIDIKFNGNLWKEQKEVLDEINSNRNNGVIHAECGTGKTYMALRHICKKGKKALVIMHRNFLIEQWKNHIDNLIENVSVGTIADGEYDYEDKDIVLALVQTLRKNVPDDLNSSVGLVVVDESHRVPAETYLSTVSKLNAKHRLGLTATDRRKDGLEDLVYWSLGKPTYMDVQPKHRMQPTIYMVQTGIEYDEPLNKYTGKIDLQSFITDVNDIEENELAQMRVDLITRFVRKNIEKNILILNDRVAFCENYVELLQKQFSNKKVELFTGGTDRDMDRLGNADIIVATKQMAAEGMDIPHLEVLMNTSIHSNRRYCQQATGRIMRSTEHKTEPIVYDFVDKNSVTQAMATNRKKFYNELNFNVKAFNFEKLEE